MGEHENTKGESSTGKLPDDELVFGKMALLGRVLISLPWTFRLLFFAYCGFRIVFVVMSLGLWSLYWLRAGF